MSYKAVLTNRRFGIVLFSQLFSKIGDKFSGLALPIYMYTTTGSAASMAFMMVTFWLPDLFLSPFFGVLVDRFDRKRLMVSMDVVRLLLIACIPFSGPEVLYALCFLLSCSGKIFDLAKMGITTQLVEREQLVEANALVRGIDQVIGTAGPLVAGTLIAILGPVWLFFMDAVTYFISACLLLFIRMPKREKSTSQEGFWEKSRRDFGEGIAFVKKSPPLLFSMSVFLFVMMFVMPLNVLFVPIMQGELGATGWHIGLAYSLASGSMLVGTLLAPVLNRLFNKVDLILIGLLATGLFYVCLAKSGNVTVALVFYALVALFSGFVNPLNGALRQENTPNELMGRVLGMYSSVITSLSIITMLGAGVVGEKYGVRDVYLIASIGYALTAVIGVLSPWYRETRQLYKPRQTPQADELA